MDKTKIKIRLLTTLNYSKIFSLYKISGNDLLDLKDEGIEFKYHSKIKKDDIISVSKYTPGGLNFEPWIKIEFNKNEEKKDIYITSRCSFWFCSIYGNNEQIEKELKMKYLKNE